MKKINEARLAQFQNGEVVLYTGDKKGSGYTERILGRCNRTRKGSSGDFYGTTGNDPRIFKLRLNEINNRPIHTVEWFYEDDEPRLSFNEIEVGILNHPAKSKYQQAAIIILRDIFKVLTNN